MVLSEYQACADGEEPRLVIVQTVATKRAARRRWAAVRADVVVMVQASRSGGIDARLGGDLAHDRRLWPAKCDRPGPVGRGDLCHLQTVPVPPMLV